MSARNQAGLVQRALIGCLLTPLLTGCAVEPLVHRRGFLGQPPPESLNPDGTVRWDSLFDRSRSDAHVDALLAASPRVLVAVVNRINSRTPDPGDLPRVWASFNRGVTWAPGPSVWPLTGEVTGAALVYPADHASRQLLVAGYQGVARCQLESGELSAVLPGVAVHEFAADSQGEVALCLLQDGSLKLSRDTGSTWEDAGVFEFDRGVTGPAVYDLVTGSRTAFVLTWEAVYQASLDSLPLRWKRVADVTEPREFVGGAFFDQPHGRLYWIDHASGVSALQVYDEARGSQKTISSLGSVHTATLRRTTGTVFAIGASKTLMALEADGSTHTLGESEYLDDTKHLVAAPGSRVIYVTNSSEEFGVFEQLDVE